MAKVIVDFGVASLVIGDLTWGACLKKSDNSAVSTTGATLTAFNATGKYWLENPNVTETTLFYIYLTATPATARLGEFIAPSSLSICNAAILNLGGKVISSFDDATTEATLCKNLWTPALDFMLRLHPWNCAIKRVALTASATVPVYEFSAMFDLPSDLLRLLEVEGLRDGFKIERRTLLCDESTINIRHVFRNENVAEWDSLLVRAMTQYMTFELSWPITRKDSVRDTNWKLFTDILRSAKNIDAMEEPQDEVGDSPFISVRG